jgi:hypothetical protein
MSLCMKQVQVAAQVVREARLANPDSQAFRHMQEGFEQFFALAGVRSYDRSAFLLACIPAKMRERIAERFGSSDIPPAAPESSETVAA